MITPKITKKQLHDELWRRGELVFLLDKNQKEMHKLFYSSSFKVLTWLLARRSGKTLCLVVLAIEQCLKQPHSIVKFLSPTKLQLSSNVRPLFRKVLETCPEELKPEYKKADSIYYFPNGSEIQLAGSDGGNAEKLRGGDSHLWLIDEAGSCNDLKDIIKSILLPTGLTTNGKGILAGTPPKEADHEFIAFIEKAEAEGSLTKKTIYDNPRITPEMVAELIAEVGGINSEEARRELFCDLIKDSNYSVIPEATDHLFREIVKEHPRPPFFDCYEAMDLGFDDLTAVLFGYYDFRSDKIIIEDELPFNFRELDKHIKVLVEKIEAKEKLLWINPLTNEVKQPRIRVSDINKIVTNELYKASEGRINFLNTRKDDKPSAINNVRTLLAGKKIIINPKCVTLIRHLKNAKWQRNKEKFARSPDDSHYDFVDALIYFVRNINFQLNPYPAGFDLNLRAHDSHMTNPSNYNKTDPTEAYRAIFGLKRKR